MCSVYILPCFPLFLSQQKLTNPVYVIVRGYRPLLLDSTQIAKKNYEINRIRKENNDSGVLKFASDAQDRNRKMVKPQKEQDSKGFVPAIWWAWREKLGVE